MFGYMGKILRIDLSEEEIRAENLDEFMAKKYIGGSGLAAKFLYDETSAQTDPMGPENLLIFMTGPFCGTSIPGSGRHAVVTKSPLTGIFAESDTGGAWGYQLKGTGYDGVIIKGQSDKPVYIYISDCSVEIHDATEFWGKDTYQTYDTLQSIYGKDSEVTCIGQAGENLVRYAAIMSGGRNGRAAGRCGTGTVMGAKNLKAIVVEGKQQTQVANKQKLRTSIRKITPAIVEATSSISKYGTANEVIDDESNGIFPLKNWTLGRWPEGVEKISGQRMSETILSAVYRCKSCIIGCGRKVKITEGRYKGIDGAGPQYQTLGALGGMCLVAELDAIAYANDLCNRYGLDTISTGAAIAFAMEAYEKKIITTADTDGIELKFGNAEAMVAVVESIAKRQGIGKVLAEGVKKAAEILGKGTEDFAIHSKGLELPARDPRALHGLALSYATSNRGACHLSGFTHLFERDCFIPELGYNKPHNCHQTEGKGHFVAKMQNLMGIYDSLKICKFSINGLSLSDMTSWLNYVSGWNFSTEDVIRTGERIYNLKRLYNVRCGINRKDDTLPSRLLTLKRTGKDLTSKLPQIEQMISDYYECRCWNKDGIPTESKLNELGLYDENTGR